MMHGLKKVGVNGGIWDRTDSTLINRVIALVGALVTSTFGTAALAEDAVGGGQAYVTQCEQAGVPIPPPWNYNQAFHGVGTQWVREPGVLGTSLAGGSDTVNGNPIYTEVFTYSVPEGLCVALPRSEFPAGTTDPAQTPPIAQRLLGVICQSKQTGKACFWDSGVNYVDGGVGPNHTLRVGNGEFEGAANIVTTFAGGTDLNDRDQCTECHKGENVFIVHPRTQLIAASVLPDEWMEPIVKRNWPMNEPPLELDATDCSLCHREGGAGRFPQLSTATETYCDRILEGTFGLTMPDTPLTPFDIPTDTFQLGLFWADVINNWPDYYTMRDLCAAPPPPESNESFKMMSMDGPAEFYWIPQSGELGDETTLKTEGTGSMSVETGGYVRLDSLPINTWIVDEPGTEVELDVYVPPAGQPNPYWLGSIDLFLSVPSAGMNNTYVGHVELTPAGTGWQTVSFDLPGQAQTALSETHPDVRWGVATNRQYGAPALLLDNMRFAGSPIATAPSPSSPLEYGFERGALWYGVDGDATSTGTSGVVAYSGSASLEVNIDGSGDGRVFTQPTDPLAPGATVTFRVFVPNGAPVVALQPYVADGNWSWSETWNTNFPQGAWVTVATTLSPHATTPVREIGIKFYLDDHYTGKIYVDAVSW